MCMYVNVCLCACVYVSAQVICNFLLCFVRLHVNMCVCVCVCLFGCER